MILVGQTKDGRGLLRIYVQPRSSRNKICGVYGDTLKIAITTPPVDGKANGTVISYLAKFFEVSKKNVSLMSGEKSRTKTVAFETLSEKELAAHLNEFL